MFVMWPAFWVALAFLNGMGLGEPRTGRGEAVARGLVAAVLSGLAFWSISGIWTHHGPGGPNYPYNFACWTFAFLPGFLALLLRRSRSAPA
jgi:hypothetical protein